jgi:hypothetical protein
VDTVESVESVEPVDTMESVESVDTVDPLVDNVPIKTSSLRVSVQPQSVWFQFGEGPLKIQFVDVNQTHRWKKSLITLVYSDTLQPVTMLNSTRSTLRTLTCSTGKDLCTITFKTNEITKNHQSRSFCIKFQVGTSSVISEPFVVRTKRTKGKRVLTHENHLTEYKKRLNSAIALLEWRVAGYVSICEGHVDYSQPLYACVLCNTSQSCSHLPDCPIRQLRNMKSS